MLERLKEQMRYYVVITDFKCSCRGGSMKLKMNLQNKLNACHMRHVNKELFN